MSWLEDRRIKKKVKKEEKRISSSEKHIETLTDANETLTELANKRSEIERKERTEEEYSKHLDRERLTDEINKARENLFVQRKRLIRRLISFNGEYKYISAQPDSPVKEDELKRCSAGAKNAAYALAVVEDTIRRLDSIHDEYEWRDIMRDLTKGYKMVNAISIGSDIMTRLAFLLQKARYDIKGDLSIEAMEHYYGRNIDDLLKEQKIDKVASEMLVNDQALELENERQILDAIRWGRIYNVQPNVAADAAEQQSERARRTRTEAVYDNPGEVYDQPMDLDSALEDLPGLGQR